MDANISTPMDEGDLTKYGARTLAFLGRYVRARAVSHAAVAIAVLAAVACSVSTQYGAKRLVDALPASAPAHGGSPWLAVDVLLFFIAADNLLWRAAGLIASYTFVRVTGDIRADLFRHLTDSQEGALRSALPTRERGPAPRTISHLSSAQIVIFGRSLEPRAAGHAKRQR